MPNASTIVEILRMQIPDAVDANGDLGRNGKLRKRGVTSGGSPRALKAISRSC